MSSCLKQTIKTTIRWLGNPKHKDIGLESLTQDANQTVVIKRVTRRSKYKTQRKTPRALPCQRILHTKSRTFFGPVWKFTFVMCVFVVDVSFARIQNVYVCIVGGGLLHTNTHSFSYILLSRLLSLSMLLKSVVVHERCADA